ncbi:MAG: hypothetical protein CL693_17735 [Cellvibrionaceae bacterium]|nr:hypothetical protein [Cellvibrionaceae bacterium]|tara:strand:+ start:4046 stop:6928 length:2883 start_codon:yes stop_codon:yes gene_type:complete
MTLKKPLSQVISLVVAGLASTAVVHTASAQDAADSIEEVVVTGSRIPRADYSANSPVSTISADDLKMKDSLNIEKLLNDMPQIAGSLGSTDVITGEGAATVDLRGLGSERTLVLINGRRVVAYDQGNSVDVAMVPSGLLEKVEVVTGGASAVYGSDALAGVVNFILKDDFEGVSLDTSYQDTTEGGGETSQINLTMGSNFADDRGNATFFVSYNDRNELRNRDRDVPNRGAYGDDFAGGITLWGSSRIPSSRIDDAALFPGATDPERVSFDPNGNAVPLSNFTGYDFAPGMTLSTPEERYNASLLMHYNLNENTTAYAEAHFKNHQTSFYLAPTPAELRIFELDYGDNPFLTADSKALFDANFDTGTGLDDVAGDQIATFSKIRRRTVENGLRLQEDEFNTNQITLGLKGDFNEDWSYDAYYSWGRTIHDQTISGDVSDTRLRNGLNVGVANDGSTRCLSQLTAAGDYNPLQDPNCVAGSIWGEGAMSDEFVDYVTVNTTRKWEREQTVLAFNVNGTLMDLPAGPLGVAAGYEYREEEARDNPDSAITANDVLGFNGAGPTKGEYDVNDFYIEAAVPLLSDVAAAKYLGLEIGYRYSDYSTIGGTDSYKFGGEWAVNDSVRFRAMYQRAVRAPNLEDLFNGFIVSNPFFTDPCNAGADAATQAFCVAQGVPAGDIATFAQADTQFEEQRFANPDLDEETSDTYTFGVVWTPESIPGLNVTLDYYDIEIEDAISVLGGDAATLLDSCYAGRDAGSVACQAVDRNTVTGDVEVVTTSIANLSQMNAEGIDLSASYNFDVDGIGIDGDPANITLSVVGNYTKELSFIAEDGADTVECQGTFGNFGCVPGQADAASVHEYTFNTALTYASGGATVRLDWRWLDEVDNHESNGTGLTIDDIESYNYFDLSARYEFENVTIYGAVENLTDKEPPFLGIWWANNSGTDVHSYDVIGRRYRLGVTMDF